MTLLVSLIWLVLGIGILIVAGDVLVRGSAAMARKWGVPSLIIGLTVVALGTSAPELVVSVGAVLKGAPGLALGNVVGSNIANMLLVLGLPAIIAPIVTTAKGTRRNVGLATLAALIFLAFAWNGKLVFWQGAVLFSLIILYLAYLFLHARKGDDIPQDIAEMADVDHMDGLPQGNLKIALFVLAGLIGLPIGGEMVGSNGVAIAHELGVSDAIIGLTIVALGTSLPELATSIIAAFRGHSELAVGNAFGSNIFNIFAVGGASAMAGTIPVDPGLLHFDVPVMILAGLLVAIPVFLRRPIGRVMGVILTGSYIAYISWLVVQAL